MSITEGDKHEVLTGEKPEAAVRRDSEQAQHAALASENGIAVTIGEPPYLVPAQRLLERYGTKMTSYFYIMRCARQYRSAQEAREDLGTFDEYVRARPTIRSLMPITEWFDFSSEGLQETHEELYPGTPFDPAKPLNNGSVRTSQYYRAMFFPFGEGHVEKMEDVTAMQEMMLYCNLVRDEHLLRLIKDYWHSGYSMFDTHGALHAVALEPVLKETLGVDRIERYVGIAACRDFLKQEPAFQRQSGQAQRRAA